MISLHTLHREYSRRADGTFEKVAIFDYDKDPATERSPSVEILVRDAQGRLLRVERKRPRSSRIHPPGRGSRAALSALLVLLFSFCLL